MIIRAAQRNLGSAAICDPFWTASAGLCSDAFGNFIRPDGSAVPFTEIVAAGRPMSPPALAPDTITIAGVTVPRWVGLAGGLVLVLVALKVLSGGGRR